MAKTLQPIIVKKKKKDAHKHHSSAWKIALADFMTALMCFFLVMWLTTILKIDTKPDVSRFFNMAGIDETDVGIGGVLGGSTITVEGPLAEMSAEFTVVPPMGAVEKNNSELLGRYLPTQETEDSTTQRTEKEAGEINRALSALEKQLQEDLQQEGLGMAAHVTREAGKIRIDLLDRYKQPMFHTGGHQLLPEARTLLERFARRLSHYTGSLTIQGHTDSARYHSSTYTNWELSTDRANAARRAIVHAAPSLKIRAVVGTGEQDLPLPNTPDAPANRRISLFFTPEGATESTESTSQPTHVHHHTGDTRTSSQSSGTAYSPDDTETDTQNKPMSRISAKKRAVKYII